MGKTRLVAEVAETARQQGAVVAVAQCFGAAGRLALAPVAEWLRSDAVQSAVAALDPVWRAEVRRLMPVGGRGASAGARARRMPGNVTASSKGLARALLAVGRPLLLVLDNMQWCDQETLAFITFCLGLAARRPDPGGRNLARGRPSAKTLSSPAGSFGCGPRDCSPSCPSARWRPPTPRIWPRLFPGSTLPDADVDLLHATTGGFPLYVIEAVRGTARAGGTPLPAGDLAAVLRKRLDAGAPRRPGR